MARGVEKSPPPRPPARRRDGLTASPEPAAHEERAFLDELIRRAQVAGVLDFRSEASNEARDALMQDAGATRMLGAWPQPFGLVAIESLALGTPVIAACGVRCPRSCAPAWTAALWMTSGRSLRPWPLRIARPGPDPARGPGAVIPRPRCKPLRGRMRGGAGRRRQRRRPRLGAGHLRTRDAGLGRARPVAGIPGAFSRRWRPPAVTLVAPRGPRSHPARPALR